MSADGDPARLALGRAVRAGCVTAGLLPWLLPLARARLPLGAVGAALDATFVTMCHRIPERTLELSGVAMPVCSRCAGVFAGVAAGGLAAWPRLSPRAWRLAITAASVAMLADVVTQDAGLHPVWHPIRIATGLLFGYALAAALSGNLTPQPPLPRETSRASSPS